MTRIFTAEPEQDFVALAAAHIRAQAAVQQIPLAECLILVPNRRAVRTLEVAFLRDAAAQALLMPRIRALGDLDDHLEDVRFAQASMQHLPPAISPIARQMLLAGLVQRFAHAADAGTAPLRLSEAWRHAGALARLLDEAQSEDVDLGQLADLVPAELAAHWQHSRQFLSLISEVWPTILAERGQVDPVQRRDAALMLLAEEWQQNPPAEPIFAVGSTGTHRAVRVLMQALLGCPNGTILLPGLDREMDDQSWQALAPSHPQ